MRLRAITLAVIIVLSTLAVGSSGAFAADAGVEGNLDDSVLRPEPVENSTEYRGYEPSQEYTEKPVELDTAPEDFSTSGTGAGAADASTSSIVMDPNDDDHPSVGTTKFYLGSDVGGYYFKTFTLVAVEDHIEVWVANDLSWPAGDPRADPVITEDQAESMATQFEQNMYGPQSEVFGEPLARPGTDGLLEQLGLVPDDYYVTDEDSGNRTVLLVDNVRDENYYDPSYPLYIAGFYSPTIQDYTDRNTIAVDAYDWNEVNESNQLVGYEGTLAHEYQHLIHGDLDGDETTWINEGMSDYAEVVSGYGLSESHLDAYEALPSNSLTNWEDQGALNVLADYGIAFAWMLYAADEHGVDFITDLANDEDNGIESAEKILAQSGDRDFYEFYQDFSIAAVTDDVELPPKDEYHVDGVTLEVDTSNDVGTAGAWGTNYEEIDTAGKGPITDVSVTGIDYIGTQWSTATDPVTGQGDVLYSGSGNLLDRFAIVEADLSGTTNPTLSFDSYQRIEVDWDYGFVQVSTDGGETWTSLENANTDDTPASGAHPTVVSNLPGLTGDTAGWESQTFDLSAYAGEEDVLIGFRYVTDWAFVKDGWWVKNVDVAGESVATDDLGPWMSEREATGDNIEYQFSFIGIKQNGLYQVEKLDMRTFDESGEQELKRFLRNGNFETVIVASTWAAESGEGGRVPVGVEVSYAHENGNGNGNGTGNGNGNGN